MDDGWGSKVLDGWEPPGCLFYICAFVASLGVRGFVCFMRAQQITFRSPAERRFGTVFWENFWGKVRENPEESDYWLPFLVGTLELVVFPILMRVGAWSVIGAWIGFKALAQFEQWKQDRNRFNMFLMGTALVVILSFFLARAFVHMAAPLPGD